MYPSRHFSISEENGFQFQGSRIPKIPISTIAAGLQEVSGDGVSGVPGKLNSLRSPGFVGELFQEDPTSNAMAAYTNSNDSIDQNRGFNNCTAGFVGINGYDHITGLYSNYFSHITKWTHTPLLNHVAYINSASEALEVPGSAIQWGPSCTAAAGSTLSTSYSWTNSSVQLSTADSSNIIQNGSYAGSSTCYPSSLPQTNQQPIAVPTLLSNKSISEILNTWNNKPASTPNYGFPTPQNINLNSCLGLAVQQEPGERYAPLQPQPVPEPPVESISCMRPTRFPWNAITNALADKPNSFHLAPLIPDPSKRMQNQVHETDEECEARELLKNGKQLDIATGIINKAIQSSTIMNSITGLSAFTEEHGNSYREDTQTPQWKKPIRKRHRPKVVTDGKPKRTPKPTTPNEEMTKRSSRKRHCVTEGTGTTENTPLHIASEAAYTTAKRSKRALNFDLEDGQGKKQNLSSASLQQHMTPDKGIQYSRGQDTNFSSQCYDQVLTNTSSGSNSSLQQQANGAEITVETLTGILPFDLNLSPIAAVSDEIILPEKHAPIIRSPATEELIKDELNSNVKIRNIVNHPNALLDGKEDDSSNGQGVQATGVGTIKFAPQNCLRSTTTRQNELSSSSNAIPIDNKQAKEIQRGYRSMDTMTRLIGYHFNSLKSYQEMLQKNEVHRNSSMHFQEIHKKDGTKEDQNNVRSLNPYLITMENNTERESACKQPGATANYSMTQPNRGESIPSSSNSNDPTNRINRADNSPVSKYPIMAIGNSLEEQDTSAELPSQTILTEGTLKTPKSPEFMPTFSKIGRKTGKISKVTRVHDFANLITIAEDKQLLPTPSKTTSTPSTEQGPKIIQGAQTCMEVLAMNSHTKAVKELSKKRAPPQGSMLNESKNELFPSEQDAAFSKYSQNTIKSIGLSERTDTNVAPHDENSKQLDYNSISDMSTQNSLKDLQVLVPFVKASTVVPYEGVFDPISKQHERPKVVLDQETERVWKLLMQNASSEDVEDTEDKRKWWEEERRVFHGRADSFIARMHLIQGDRRFSKWKGSIVDSVVGVFLTQNVSDHLSSSAFMALAAQFPHQPTGHTTRPEARTIISIKKQEVSVTRSDKHDRVIKKANMSGEADAIKGSITEQIEDGEMAKSKGSSPTNIESSIIADNLKEKHLAVSRNGKDPWHGSLENKTHSLSMQIEKPNSFEAQTCDLLEDKFSSQNAASSSHNSYYESRDLKTVKKLDIFENSTFMELLYMANSTVLREYYKDGNGGFNHNHVDSQARGMGAKRGPLNMDGIHWPKEDILPNSQSTNFHSHFTQAPTIPSSKFGLQMVNPESEAETSLQMVNPESEAVEAEFPVIFGEESRYFLQTNGTEIKEPQDRHHITKNFRTMTETSISSKVENKSISSCEDIQRNKSIQNKVVKSNSREQLYISAKLPNVTASTSLKTKKKSGSETKEPVDWDYLRKEVHPNGLTSKRNNNATDSVNWEAVRHANVDEIATVIKERGLNNMLAARIKDFLNRLVREHGRLDLEWLRDVSPDKAKEYLLSIRGLGLKSVECVRLLTLQHVAFPVDTNVARIAVRLGWVPLQPLPESLQLHLLELYPVLESIQKYLWPRLCTLDQRTLYELHYQMITFGKVFCTKRQPNCNACPMKAECRHFASAFASVRLTLPGPEERQMVSLTGPASADYWPDVSIGPIKLSFQEIDMGTRCTVNKCEPIIEEPASPENQQTESDLEDAFYEDQNEIPTIRLNIEEFTLNLQNYIQEQNGEFQEGDMSKAIVALNPAKAAIPMPKLKNVSRLRTEHQVYELPDSHPLLREEQLDRREPDDPCPYLLAIWAPGETAESTSPPERHCHSQQSGDLCDKKTCFSCNSIREADSHMVRGTILIPSKTAMRGSFPLNGTYFQVNEVFADHDSSLHPIHVNRNWIWNLPRRTVFFGTSIPTIFRGLSTEEIQRCFWRGFVCIRGFDTKTRAPRPLTPRFHLPASKVTKTKTKRNIK